MVLLALLAAALGLLGYHSVQREKALQREIAKLSASLDESTALSRQAALRAERAEASARVAAQGRLQAEGETAEARQDAEEAREQAASAEETAALAQAETARASAEVARVRRQAEAELQRLESALGQVAETHRTALGLVMRLGSDYLKFEFDKAELRPADRELLSRVAGILLSSQDYTVSVNGHTDDIGSEAYNQKLSERRAEAVRDYLVSAGLPAEILTVTGHGKARPLVPGSSVEARSKNRRVELGIVNTRIRYGPSLTDSGAPR